MRILIVEDEFKIADVIASRLRKENYIVDVFGDGEEGLDNALTNIYDLIILDVMLPKVDGFKILEEIRREKINAKVIMLTAKSMIEDKLTGFNNGANDYLTKPFHIDELVARVDAQLRMDNVQVQRDYVEAGGKISIALKKQKNDTVLTVSNRGKEIPKEIREKIFERFYRADESRNRDTNRYGLGLATAKNIVENHNGKISVESEKGITTFKVVLK